jgi:hypothetical protein
VTFLDDLPYILMTFINVATRYSTRRAVLSSVVLSEPIANLD